MSRTFGIGIDLVAIKRINSLLSNPVRGERFLQRAFHPHEIQAYRALNKDRGAEFLAARWAAKEATQKAFAYWRIPYNNIEIKYSTYYNDDSNRRIPGVTHSSIPLQESRARPVLEFHGDLARLANDIGIDIKNSNLSITHDEGLAQAYVQLVEFPH